MKITTLFVLVLLYQVVSAQVSLSGNSYKQNFDLIAKGLPKGWRVYIGASDTAAGTQITDESHLVLKPVLWKFPYGNFRNCASAEGHSSFSKTDSAIQCSSTNRALAVRQVSPNSTSFPGSDPGVTFVFEIANTSGKKDFNLTFNLQSLDSISPRITTWTVDYGVGNKPAVFTAVSASGTMTTGGHTFSNNLIQVNFKDALDNKADPVWIRIVALKSSDGSSYRTTTGIDNFNLTWSNSGSKAGSK